MSLTIQQEISGIREMSSQEFNQAGSDQAFLESMRNDDIAKANSTPGTFRSNGTLEMRGTYHPDTIINVRGVDTRVDAAIAAGLVDTGVLGSPIQDTVTPEQPQESTGPTVADQMDTKYSISPEMTGQIQYVEQVLGEEVSDQVLADVYVKGHVEGDHIIEQLSAASGLSPTETASSIEQAANAKIQPIATAFEHLVGQKVDMSHALQWVQSNAVSEKDRMALKIAMRTGNAATLSTLAHKYKQHYQL